MIRKPTSQAREGRDSRLAPTHRQSTDPSTDNRRKAMTNNTNDDFEDLYKDLAADEREYMQRYHKPDAVCFHCGQPANQHHPVGPITITVSDPDGDESTHEFWSR